MKITHCEKHHVASYHKDDGSVVHTCTVCYPEIVKKVEKSHKRITNYGAVFVNGHCSDFTLDHIVKNGHIEFAVPDHAADYFFNDCVDFGVDVDYGTNNVNGLKIVVYRSGAKNNQEKQWYSSNVVFPSDKNLELPGLNVRVKGKRLVVSSNEFAGYVMSKV